MPRLKIAPKGAIRERAFRTSWGFCSYIAHVKVPCLVLLGPLGHLSTVFLLPGLGVVMHRTPSAGCLYHPFASSMLGGCLTDLIQGVSSC